MKKLIVLLFTVSSLCYQSNSQSIYYDAMKLKRWAEMPVANLPVDSLANALSNYMPSNLVITGDAFKTIKNFKDLNNPFFTAYFNLGQQNSNISFSKALSSIGSSVGGLNVTNFADGLAKFLVKRFKEELSITFFEKFKDEVKKIEELRTLFPQTYKVFQVIDKEIYNFSKYLNSLREAFIKDLGNLYVGLKKLKALPKYKAILDANPEIKAIVLNAFYFIDQFAAGTHPGEVIANYKEDEYLKFSNSSTPRNLENNMRSSVKVLKLFSASLKSISADNYWVPSDSIKSMLADPVSLDMYFGLIYQKTADIHFQTNNGSLTFQGLLKKAKETAGVLKQYKDKIENIMDHAQEVNEYIADLKEKKKSEIDYNDYYKLFNASLDILNEGLSIIDLPALDIEPVLKQEIEDEISKWINLARTAGELYVDIRTKNYSSAILNSVSILDDVFGSDLNPNVRENILKYGNFIATVAAAQNSDEVEDAIEAIALPVGSSRIKRESLRNISLNAYVGGFAGGEYMPVLNKEKKTSFVFGLSAPVGVAFSFGNFGKGSKGERGGKSASIFISLIDVGALATFRMNDDDTKVASEIELKNIVAPGVFFYYGFGKCPISIGAGVQLGPQLREVTTTNINIEKNYYIRYGVTLAVDIPLLNFYIKSK